MSKTTTIILWILRILVSVILLQTLYFKFSGHPESVALFTKLGVEPWGRIALGSIELVVGIALLIPKTSFIGSFFSSGILAGAIGTHLLVIGIVSNNDGGALFGMAVTGFLLSSALFLIQKNQKKSDSKNPATR